MVVDAEGAGAALGGRGITLTWGGGATTKLVVDMPRSTHKIILIGTKGLGGKWVPLPQAADSGQFPEPRSGADQPPHPFVGYGPIGRPASVVGPIADGQDVAPVRGSAAAPS